MLSAVSLPYDAGALAARQKRAELTVTFKEALERNELVPNVGLSVSCSEVVARSDDTMERMHETDHRMYEK